MEYPARLSQTKEGDCAIDLASKWALCNKWAMGRTAADEAVASAMAAVHEIEKRQAAHFQLRVRTWLV